MGNKNNYIVTGVVVVIVLLIFVLSFWLKDDSGSEQTTQTTEVSQTPITESDAPDLLDEYKDWRRYEDELTGMTFLYPEDLSIKFTEGTEYNTYSIYDKNFVQQRHITGDIRVLRREVNIFVYPFTEEKFSKLTKDFEKEIDVSDTLGVAHTERMLNQTFEIKGYQLNSELNGSYLASLFRVGDHIFRVEAFGQSQSIADGILFTFNFNDKNTSEE